MVKIITIYTHICMHRIGFVFTFIAKFKMKACCEYIYVPGDEMCLPMTDRWLWKQILGPEAPSHTHCTHSPCDSSPQEQRGLSIKWSPGTAHKNERKSYLLRDTQMLSAESTWASLQCLLLKFWRNKYYLLIWWGKYQWPTLMKDVRESVCMCVCEREGERERVYITLWHNTWQYYTNFTLA